jgi:hypothetical protein
MAHHKLTLALGTNDKGSMLKSSILFVISTGVGGAEQEHAKRVMVPSREISSAFSVNR